MNLLENTTVVVIGGGAGMGLAIARHAAAAGASVVIAGRTLSRLQQAASARGPAVRAESIDTTSEDSVRDFFGKLGPIDHLAIPGSAVRTGTLKDAPLADGLTTMQSKFWGPYLCAKHAQVKPTGSITLFSGILSRRPGKNDCVLRPVNAAVEALGRALSRDLAPVRVNTLSPGMTSGTDAYKDMPEAARQGMYDAIAARLPVGRVGTPDDIAQATLALMTNGFITGTTLDVDGGALLQ